MVFLLRRGGIKEVPATRSYCRRALLTCKMMATNSTRMIILVLLPFLLMVQLVNGNVVVNNTSGSTVSVTDKNTTIITDPLKPNDWTSFVLGSAGPDLFHVEKYVNGSKVSAFADVVVHDGETLLLYTTKKKKLKSTIIKSSPDPPAAGPTSN